MTKQRKWTLAAIVAGLLVVALPQALAGWNDADPASTGDLLDLSAVRIATDAQGRPTVDLNTGGRVEYETFVLDAPERLVLDLPGVLSRLDEYRFHVGEGGVLQVRAAQHRLEPVPVTRIVFDLEAPVAYGVDAGEDGVRVVFGDPLVDAAGVERWKQAAARQAAPDFSTASVAAAPSETIAAVIEKAEEPAVEVAAPAAGVLHDDSLASVLAELEARAEEWPAAVVDEPAEIPDDRALEPGALDRLVQAPVLAAPAAPEPPAAPQQDAGAYESRTISSGPATYGGKRISLNLVDADLKQVFRLFHEISGLNFVLDPDVAGSVTIVLDQVPWDQALDLILKNNGLDKVLEGNVLRIASTQKLAREAASRKQLKEAEELEVEPLTLTRTLSYAKAKDVERVIRDGGILSARGRVIVDERTNTLIISDIPKKVDPVDTLISVLDSETPQVMIEARIVETSRNYTQDLGVSWGFSAVADASRGTSTGLSFPHNASARYGLNLPGQAANTLAFSFGNVVDSFTLDLALNALETEGEGRILSSPRIATQNNERAEIEQGVRIPIVNTTATEINVEFVSASLLLSVTPQITAEGTIILDIIVENNSPDFINTAADIPSIRTQRAQTKVLINDGGTTVIGGIFTVNEGQSEIGVPWFRKLPIFGWLFRSQNITNENRELLIFITPKIVTLG